MNRFGIEETANIILFNKTGVEINVNGTLEIGYDANTAQTENSFNMVRLSSSNVSLVGEITYTDGVKLAEMYGLESIPEIKRLIQLIRKAKRKRIIKKLNKKLLNVTSPSPVLKGEEE